MVALIPFFLALVASILPALVWLFFFMREDLHPEPKNLIAYTFGIGGLMSIPTLAAQIILKHLIPTSMSVTGLIVFAFVEEVFKFFALYWAVRKNPAFDEPVDAMIYAVTAALGFATIENFFIIGGSWETLASLSAQPTLQTAALRFIGATFLHALTSGIVGYFWARGMLRKMVRPWIIQGLIIATIIHSLFNFLILKFQKTNNLLYPSLFLITIVFFVLIDFEKLRVTTKTFPPSS